MSIFDKMEVQLLIKEIDFIELSSDLQYYEIYMKDDINEGPTYKFSSSKTIIFDGDKLKIS